MIDIVLLRLFDGTGSGVAAGRRLDRSARLPVSPGTDAIEFGIVSTAAELHRLADDWNALFDRTGKAHHVFQTHSFVELWAQAFTAPDRTGSGGQACTTRIAILTARRSGRLVLVWPLVDQRELGLKVLSWLGEPVAQYGDVLIDPAERTLPLLRAAYHHMRETLAPDILRLRKVRQDATIMPLLAEIGATASDHVEAPFVTLAAGANGASFEKRQNGKAKKNRRRLLRRLEGRGCVQFVAIAGTPSAVALTRSGLDCKRDWLLRRGLFSATFADERLDRFLADAAREASAGIGCTVFGLYLDDHPIAVALGFLCKQRLMLHLITHAEAVDKCGAGVLNLEAILRHCEAADLAAVDLLPPKADYKLDWADGAVAVADHVHGLTAPGRMWCGLFDGFLRPNTKRALQFLPLRLRRWLVARSLGRGR